MLDNVDLGIFNKPHNVLPRIADFDPDSLRKMLTMALDPVKGATSYSHANLRDASTVCYMRSKVQVNAPSSSTSKRVHRCAKTPVAVSMVNTTTPVHVYTSHACNDSAAHSNKAAPGPLEFAHYLREKYPHLVADELTMMLKHQNSRMIMQLTQAGNSI